MARTHGRASDVRAKWLHADAVPWGEKPPVGAMLARLDAFCARYAAFLEVDAKNVTFDHGEFARLLTKAVQVRAPFNWRMR